jgi:hypothetical protein
MADSTRRERPNALSDREQNRQRDCDQHPIEQSAIANSWCHKLTLSPERLSQYCHRRERNASVGSVSEEYVDDLTRRNLCLAAMLGNVGFQFVPKARTCLPGRIALPP